MTERHERPWGWGVAGSDDDETSPGITREEVIEQLRDAGLFSTRVIGGRTPDDYTDAELADLMDEFADRTVVAEELGKEVRDVTEADVAAVDRAADQRAVQDTLGIDPGGLTPLGKMIVDAELRDPTGTSSSAFDDLLGEVARGGGRSFFQAPTTDQAPGQGTGTAGGGTGAGAGSGIGPGAGPRAGSPFGDDPFPRGGSPSGAPAGGAPAEPDETVVGGADEPERHGGEEVDTVFQMTTGDTKYYRTDDGEWFDEDGHQVTDPDSITVLDGGYQEHRWKGGTDDPGTLTTSGYTHEEAGGAQPGTKPDDGEVRSGSDDEPEEEDEDEPLVPQDDDGADGADEDEEEDESASGSGGGTSGEEDPAGGVGFTPDPDAPVLPPLESLVFEGYRPRPGQVDPADDAATSGPFETRVEARGPDRFDLFGNPGSPGGGLVGVGSGPHPGGGFLGPNPGQINPTRDGDAGFATSGREDDPFDTGAPPDLAERSDVGSGSSAGADTSDDRGGHFPDDLTLVGDRHGYSSDFDDVPFERSGASSDDDRGGSNGGDAGPHD